MNPTGTYLAVFLGSRDAMQAWRDLPETERVPREREGMAAWKAWAEKHQASIVTMGGPLSRTKKISKNGIADINNDMGAFTVVRASSHDEAAKMFEKHPHFMVFPGDSVEVMPILEIPNG